MQAKLNEYKQKLKLSNQLIAKFSQSMGMQQVPDHQPAEVLGPQSNAERLERDIERQREEFVRLNRDLQV